LDGVNRLNNLSRIETALGITYSNYQRDVLLGNQGAVVMAGAGAGKTSILAAKVGMYFLEYNRVDDILLATFSKKAVGELNVKVRQVLSCVGGWNSPSSQVEARTLHSLFYRTLVDLGYLFEIISEVEERGMIRGIVRSEGIQVRYGGIGERDETFKVLAGAFDYASNKLMELKEVYALQELERYITFDGLKLLRGKLEYMKLIEHRYTQEDLQRVLAKVLLANKNDERVILNRKYHKFIFDEFQDTSPIQARILKVMTHGKECDCTFIGDVEQSIYGFRGASHEILANIDQGYNIKRFNLPVNYRSKESIVDKANVLASYNSYNVDRVPMEALDGVGEGCVSYHKVKDEDVYDVMYSKIRGLDGTVCVETRTNAQNILMHLKLLSKGLRHSYSGEINLSKVFKAEMNLIDLLADKDMYDEGRAIYNLVGITLSKAKVIDKMMYDYEVGIYGFMVKLYAEDGGDYDAVFLKQLEIALGSLVELKRSLEPLRVLLSIKDELERLKRSCSLREGRSDSSKRGKLVERHRELIKMFKECGSFSCLAGKLTTLALKSLPNGEVGNRISLQTIHQSKGLEYDYVLRPFCDNLNQPNMARLEKLKAKGFSVGTIRAEVEEERRLEYVALTRAKRECIYFISDIPSKVSPFIYEIFGKTENKGYKSMQKVWAGLNL
jgi:DNA helicase II / ATP-dependent DNA helicase PcrA